MSTTTGTFPGIRIVDMPDLGAFTADSSVVGEHAGSGRFSATAFSGYLGGFFLPLSGGTVTGAVNITATGTTASRSLQDRAADIVNVKDFGAKGDTWGRQDAAMSAGSNILTTASSAFSAIDVGKTIIIHGTGPSHGPQAGTITAFASATSITVSFSATFAASGANIHVGSDDAAAVAAAVNAARPAGKTVYFPAGAYWLVGQTTSMSLNGVALRGEHATKNFFPYTAGSTLFIWNSSVSAFSGITGTTITSLAFYYPAMDGLVTPVVYPALFQVDSASSSNADNWFEDVRVLNAYRVFQVTIGGSLGRTFMSNCLMYGVDAIFDMQSGFADILEINGCYFGPGAFGSEATDHASPLFLYTINSGAVLRLDMAGGGYPNADGLEWTSGIVGSYRYAIQLKSGLLDVSNISNVNFDTCQTILDVTGSANVTAVSISGGEVFSSQPANAASTSHLFHISTTNTVNDITITGVHFTSCTGDVFHDDAGTINSLVMAGNHFQHWGRTTTAGTYCVYTANVASPAKVAFSGNLFDGDRGTTSNSICGIYPNVAANGVVAITGNTFNTCTRAIQVSGNAGNVSIVGNVSSQSANAIADASTGTCRVYCHSNDFDIAPALRSPTISAGTGAAMVANSSSERGRFTVGSGTVTSGTLTFATPLNYVPVGVALTGTTAVALSVTAIGADHFDFVAASNVAGAQIFYTVTM